MFSSRNAFLYFTETRHRMSANIVVPRVKQSLLLELTRWSLDAEVLL
jgi:hypothetical protein